MMLFMVVFLGFLGPLVAVALAQTGSTPTPTLDWKPILAATIQVPIVMALVQLIKVKLPAIQEKAPYVLPLLGGLLGPLLMLAQTQLGGWLGVPIDLSAVTLALGLGSGTAAVTAHQVYNQHHKSKEVSK